MNVTQSGNAMGKDDFLKLFTSQLKNQDPLNPMDSAAFTSQLAQFSSLEQLYNVNDKLSGLLESQDALNNAMSANFLGKRLEFESGAEGIVVGLELYGGSVNFVLDNGEKYTLSDIREIHDV